MMGCVNQIILQMRPKSNKSKIYFVDLAFPSCILIFGFNGILINKALLERNLLVMARQFQFQPRLGLCVCGRATRTKTTAEPCPASVVVNILGGGGK